MRRLSRVSTLALALAAPGAVLSQAPDDAAGKPQIRVLGKRFTPQIPTRTYMDASGRKQQESMVPPTGYIWYEVLYEVLCTQVEGEPFTLSDITLVDAKGGRYADRAGSRDGTRFVPSAGSTFTCSASHCPWIQSKGFFVIPQEGPDPTELWVGGVRLDISDRKLFRKMDKALEQSACHKDRRYQRFKQKMRFATKTPASTD